MRARRWLLPAILVLLVTAGCSSDKAGRKDGAIAKAGKISVFDVHVGDCLDPGKELAKAISDIQAVPCAKPHTHEVFALPEYPGSTDVYPGEDKLRDFANAQCLESFGTYTGQDYLDSKLFFSYLQPSILSWNNGKDRTVMCVIVANGKPVTGSNAVAGAKTGTTQQKSKAQRAAESKAKAAAREKARKAAGLNH